VGFEPGRLDNDTELIENARLTKLTILTKSASLLTFFTGGPSGDSETSRPCMALLRLQVRTCEWRVIRPESHGSVNNRRCRSHPPRQPAPACGTSLGHLAAALAVPDGDETRLPVAVVRAAQARLHGPAATDGLIPGSCAERAKGRADSLTGGAPWADLFVPVPPHVGLSWSCRRPSTGLLGSKRQARRAMFFRGEAGRGAPSN
jgi:hypothetical protein